MTKELATTKNFALNVQDLEDTQKMSELLMKQKHYQKMGADGIFAILQMAKSLGADPLQCLNGSLYFVQGRIEMSGQMMMSLIRQAGHSVTKDKRSTDTLCILHGRRADTGDTWVESFGVEDAKRAGLVSNGTYTKYGKLMFQWRALSALARFLFPDVIKGCYVQGEISEAPPMWEEVDMAKESKAALQQGLVLEAEPDTISKEEAEELFMLISECDPAKQMTIWEFMKKKCQGTQNLSLMKKECYPNIKRIVLERREEYQAKKMQEFTDEVEIDENV